MKFPTPFLFCISLLAAGPGFAGSLNNGVWSASKCGDKPATPIVDDKSVDTYNSSVKAINEWQQQANTYYACIVAEANADNNAIAAAANQQQAEFKNAFETINAQLDAAKNKLSGK